MSADPHVLPGRFRGLSVKLIATIIVAILAVEIAIFLPSVAGFRAGWLDDRLRIGTVAARVLDAVPDVMALPRTLTDRLLTSAGADAIVYRREGQSQLIALADAPTPPEAVTADMRQRDPLALIHGALDTLVSGGGRTLRIVGPGDSEESLVEILMPERALYADTLAYSQNFLWVSVAIAAVTALALYIAVSVLFIGPIRRVTANMLAYRQAPENASLILAPSRRRDEIGILERELAAMETDIHSLLRQRRHLAELGLAVAKINHDLRNTLASAQLLSDQVATLDDPEVQRLAPRLVTTLDRAIGFAQSVIDYGRQSTAPPDPRPVELRALAEDAAFDAGLAGHPRIAFLNALPAGLTLRLDPGQFGRVLVNLIRNAREALEPDRGETAPPPEIRLDFAQTDGELRLSIADNGPGLPPRAKENLFIAFEGSARAGGAGLGLVIARELTEAHGGRLVLAETTTGTRFEIRLPTGLLVA